MVWSSLGQWKVVLRKARPRRCDLSPRYTRKCEKTMIAKSCTTMGRYVGSRAISGEGDMARNNQGNLICTYIVTSLYRKLRRRRWQFRDRKHDSLQFRLVPSSSTSRRVHCFAQLALHFVKEFILIVRRRSWRIEAEARGCMLGVGICVIQRLLHEDVGDGCENVHHDRMDVANKILPQQLLLSRRAMCLPYAIDGL